jgi:hypothetical protein
MLAPRFRAVPAVRDESYRVPTARLAAAQAALVEEKAKKK